MNATASNVQRLMMEMEVMAARPFVEMWLQLPEPSLAEPSLADAGGARGQSRDQDKRPGGE